MKLNQIALLGLIGQAAALGSQIQSVGDCGNTAGGCITMTPVDNNPKGGFISATPCSATTRSSESESPRQRI
jgi:hypothetical protein